MPRRVFLVEDSAVMRAYLSVRLEQLDAEIVGSAETEEAAKVWIDANPDGWDLAVIDLFLLEGTGAGVIRYCRRHGLRQRIVVVTNHYITGIAKHCKHLGADRVFSKSDGLADVLDYCANLPD